MNKRIRKPRNEDMYKAILTLETVDELMKFFDDLCTVAELQAMEQRFQVAELLNEGMIYNDILDRTGASSATIRASRRPRSPRRPCWRTCSSRRSATTWPASVATRSTRSWA